MNAQPSADERTLPMFPLQTVLFPGSLLPLRVFEPRYRALMADCLAADGNFGVVLISRGPEVGGGDQRVSLGTEAHIEQASPFPDGRWTLIARGVRRIAVQRWLPDDPYPLGIVRSLPAHQGDVDPSYVQRTTAAVRRARALLSELGDTPPLANDASAISPGTQSHALAESIWQLCASAPLGALDRQRLLEIDDCTQLLSTLEHLCTGLAADLHKILSDDG